MNVLDIRHIVVGHYAEYMKNFMRADVFIFAVHTCQDPQAYDPLDLDAWDFYALHGSTIRQIGQRSMNLTRVRSFAGDPIKLADLRVTIVQNAPQSASSAQ